MEQFFYINFIIVAILLVMSSCEEEIDPNDKPCASVAFAVGDSLQTRMLYGIWVFTFLRNPRSMNSR